MGSFTCLELARRKLSVVGIDRFAPPHSSGSHSGETRIYREAYAEGSGYVPIAQRAGQLWDKFGEEAGAPLLTRCGMLSMGAPGSAILEGIARSAAAHQLNVERLSSADIQERYPIFSLPHDHSGIFDPGAGWVDVPAAITFAIQQARRAGAEIVLDTAGTQWEARPGEVRVTTDRETFTARTLVIVAGAWASRLLPQLPLQVMRRVLIWVDPLEPALFPSGDFPVFMFDNSLYGFPIIGGKGVKIALDLKSGGNVSGPDGIAPADENDSAAVLAVAARFMPRLAGPLPGAFGRVRSAATCLYTMTPDTNFIIDRHPQFDNVCFGAGFSGHGFKFAPAVGEILADLATTGKPKLPADFLRMRF
jgi:sarcosine oxidase